MYLLELGLSKSASDGLEAVFSFYDAGSTTYEAPCFELNLSDFVLKFPTDSTKFAREAD